MNQIIRTNSNGQLLYNALKKEFTVEFGNVYFKLPEEDYLLFEKQLNNLSNDYSMYSSGQKIMVPVAKTEINLMLTPEELISLKNLFGMEIEQLKAFKLKINYSMN